MQCRDRYGSFPMSVFRLWTCAMCYKYLFYSEPQLQTNGVRPWELVPVNGSKYPDNVAILPDITNSSVVQYVCQELSDSDCNRWKLCCQGAIDCCDRQLKLPPDPGNGDVCPRTWDGYGCFDDTPAGTTASITCPSYIEHAADNAPAYKECTTNATWFRDSNNNMEWTDYTDCVHMNEYRSIVFLGLACNIITILLLMPACVIFLAFRQLRMQQRIRLHVCLFVSFVLTAIITILWDFLVYYNRLENSALDTLMHQNTGSCKTLYVLSRYARTANYLWMFCEGFYLHRLIVHAFEVPKSLIPYYLFGWGAGWIPVIIYSIIRATSASLDISCWVVHAGNYEWIVYTPNLICIVANLFFFFNILRILVTQISTHPNEPSNYRRAFTATFILVPLFGLQWFLIIYRPDKRSDFSFAYEIISTVLQNTQGAIISLVFCFCNGEVHTHVKRFIRDRWPEVYQRHSGLRRGSASSLTQYTQVSSAPRRTRNSPSPERPPPYIALGCVQEEFNDKCSNGSALMTNNDHNACEEEFTDGFV